MKAVPLKEFMEKHFEDAGDLAKVMNVDRNTIYRNLKKGVIVVGTKKNFTTYHPKVTVSDDDPSIRNQLSLID